MPDYFNLGTYTRTVTTRSEHAREWVRRGLLWAYAFNHAEAVACFEQAIEADPGCSLAYWGLAYALGPNYNKQWDMFEPGEARSAIARAHAALASAQRHASAATSAERALITALTHRYPENRPGPDWSAWNQAYADAMRTAHRQHPADLDVAALFADALMNLTPWALWDTATGQPADGAATVEARAAPSRRSRARPAAATPERCTCTST
jgi:tetratricopeptide (TPR) repeat protein